jgi:hypothetical protein
MILALSRLGQGEEALLDRCRPVQTFAWTVLARRVRHRKPLSNVPSAEVRAVSPGRVVKYHKLQWLIADKVTECATGVSGK